MTPTTPRPRRLAVGFLALTLAAVGCSYTSRNALPVSAVSMQSSTLYADDGTPIHTFHAQENRQDVSLQQIPLQLRDAVIAIEDERFYRHHGVDLRSVMRAAGANANAGGVSQGGSTITQQYVKQTYLSSQRTLARKIKEAVLAVKVERKYTKKEILERYLNTIYFGRGAYGVQAASRAYFGVDVGQLQLPQAALLAGLIRAPVLADPSRNMSVAKARRAATLKAMQRDHRITAAERQSADQTPLPTAAEKAAQLKVANPNDGSQYFVEYVRQLLVHQYGTALVLTGGLRVTTTLDSTMQQRAYDAVYGYLNQRTDPAGALVAVDDQGRVRAMVGGQHYDQSQVNLALGTEGGGTGRQAGSTFKAFLLAETVKEGYSVNSSFPAPAQIILKRKGVNGTDYPVNNFENEVGGPSVNLIDATAKSLNTVFAQLEMDIGPSKLVAMAQQMGIVHADLQPNASLVLGTSEVSVLDMAGAYSTFADEGTHIDPSVIIKVTTADGTQLPWPQPKRTAVLTRAQSDIVTYCLQQVVLRGTGTGAAISQPIAGKTGTTNDYTDAWFIGYAPKLTAAVWIGDPHGATPMHGIHGVKNVNGGSIPATLFNRFMSAIAKDPKYSASFGGFAPVLKFPGALLGLPTSVGYPQGTGATTTTTTPGSTTTTTTKKPTSSVPTGSTLPPTTAPPTTKKH
jgi:penicillin-binding protein 1A